MIFKKYTKEFYMVNIREGYVEDNPKRVSRYINGLRFEIQDEMNLLCPIYMEESYQLSLKVEYKLERNRKLKSQGIFRGRGPMRGRGNLVEVINSGLMNIQIWEVRK